MHLTVTLEHNDDILSIEVSPDMTVSDLRAYALEEAGCKPDSKSVLFFNNHPLKGSVTLEEAGLHNDDILLLGSPDRISAELGGTSHTASFPSRTTTFPASQTTNGSTPNGSKGSTNDNSSSDNVANAADANGASFNGSNPNDPYEDPSFGAQIEAARRQILYDPQLFVQLAQQSPELADALHDPEQFKRAYLVLQQQQVRNKAETDEIDRNFRLAMGEMPEAFTTVTMLFANIEVNNIPVKAFIDSGAQTTIMSPECAERCNLSHLIDKRHRGMAYGVGQATILGRIHMAPIKIGSSFFACSMTVIEGTNMEFLLGLDMLKHHQATIDLRRNRLLMGHEELPFLSEGEIPKNLMGPPGSAGPALISKPLSRGTTLNTSLGVATGAKDAGSSSGDSTSQSQTQGSQTQGSQRQDQPPHQPDQRTHRPEAASSSSDRQSTDDTAHYDEASVRTLMNLGFTKAQVIKALRKAGGNADVAAAMLFGE